MSCPWTQASHEIPGTRYVIQAIREIPGTRYGVQAIREIPGTRYGTQGYWHDQAPRQMLWSLESLSVRCFLVIQGTRHEYWGGSLKRRQRAVREIASRNLES